MNPHGIRSFPRRLRSACLAVSQGWRSWRARFLALHFQDGIQLGARVRFDTGALLSATDQGAIRIGNRVSLGRMTRVVARGGKVSIGDDVFVGDGSVIVGLAGIEIGEGTQLAEYVVIRDQDHDMTSRPFITGRFRSMPIVIGRDCWLGAKVTVLKGSRIGDGAVIGAHSLVRGDIPAHTLAVGSPAKVVKRFSAPRNPGLPDARSEAQEVEAS
jgi:acetyltransferase-like isoleucine patch superfamily enzyme